jgi:CheY-like chemotaxis protein
MLQPNVLVIDEDYLMRDMLSQVLRLQGITVQTAIGAEDALIVMRHNRPDLVLCDLAMRDMGGLLLLKAMKADPDLTVVPVVFVSPRLEQGEKEYAQMLGAAGCLEQPFDVGQLFHVITVCIATTIGSRAAQSALRVN